MDGDSSNALTSAPCDSLCKKVQAQNSSQIRRCQTPASQSCGRLDLSGQRPESSRRSTSTHYQVPLLGFAVAGSCSGGPTIATMLPMASQGRIGGPCSTSPATPTGCARFGAQALCHHDQKKVVAQPVLVPPPVLALPGMVPGARACCPCQSLLTLPVGWCCTEPSKVAPMRRAATTVPFRSGTVSHRRGEYPLHSCASLHCVSTHGEAGQSSGVRMSLHCTRFDLNGCSCV